MSGTFLDEVRKALWGDTGSPLGAASPAERRIAGNPVGTETTYAAENPDPGVRPAYRLGDIGDRRKVAEMMARQAQENPMSMMFAGGTAPGGPIRAFHGSPHSFDRFDMSKIGTGEGAQAYGHGLYFADREAIARGYRDKLTSGDRRSVGDLTKDGAAAFQAKLAEIYADAASSMGISPRQVKQIDGTNGALRSRALDELGPEHFNPGSMYEVALHTEPSKLLDWDKPLGAQPIEARNIADTVGRVNSGSLLQSAPMQTGADLWQGMRNPRVARELGYDKWGSSGPADYLKDTGIPGIQYLDAGSRSAGEGSRNYVMFDPSIIEILRKYGIVPPITLGALQRGMSGPPQEEAQ